MNQASKIAPPGHWHIADSALRHADTEADRLACFSVMHELRPHLRDADEFMQRTGRAREQGYRILAAWEQGVVVALAGYRFQENLVYGPFLYVDDLVAEFNERVDALPFRHPVDEKTQKDIDDGYAFWWNVMRRVQEGE